MDERERQCDPHKAMQLINREDATWEDMNIFVATNVLPPLDILLLSTLELQNHFDSVALECGLSGASAIKEKSCGMSRCTARCWTLLMNHAIEMKTPLKSIIDATTNGSSRKAYWLLENITSASLYLASFASGESKLTKEDLENVLMPHAGDWFLIGALCGIDVRALEEIEKLQTNSMMLLIQLLSGICGLSLVRVKHAVNVVI